VVPQLSDSFPVASCLQDPVIQAKLGFLYESYSRRHPYWETTEMLRKFAIAFIPVGGWAGGFYVTVMVAVGAAIPEGVSWQCPAGGAVGSCARLLFGAGLRVAGQVGSCKRQASGAGAGAGA
jgi:hypothetical protein